MPRQATPARAKRDRLEGKSASTQAGEFVREEIHDIRKGKHGARSPQQAIAIGLSKARRAGVKLKPPEPGNTSERTRRQATRDYVRGQGETKPRTSAKRAASAERALKREPRDTASTQALATHARTAASRRSGRNRSEAAQKAVQTKGPAQRVAAARRAARTRAGHSRTEASAHHRL
jgi:hypothetical protein